ncbi:MAG: 16S rRNA (cytosine(1402)-N(4))-methyltransferase RsmH [Patescibacteria group bacterium]
MTIHKPVLLKEAVEGLNLKKDAVVVDATLGGGGHSIAILKKIGVRGKLIAIDADENALERFKIQSSKSQIPNKFQFLKSKDIQPVINWQPKADNFLVKDNFANLKNILGGLGVETVDAVLADLGYSSDQLEDVERGMSFLSDAPLDMRLDQNGVLTAKEIVNGYAQNELEKILKIYGEEKFAKSIARKIVEYRKNKAIETTLELARIIESAVSEKYKHGKISPATKTFQAIRIEVNQELENLEKFIPQAIDILATGGRLGIISFHSLEDRIVKNIIRENARGCICPPNFPQCRCGHKAKVKIITKRPIVPDEIEIKENPRARSAKLRIAEKI